MFLFSVTVNHCVDIGGIGHGYFGVDSFTMTVISGHNIRTFNIQQRMTIYVVIICRAFISKLHEKNTM